MMKKGLLGFISGTCMIMVLITSTQAATFKIGDVDWSIGGSLRLDTGWRYTDFGDSAAAGQASSQQRFFLENPGDSRIHTTAQYGKMSGFVELGLATDNTVKVRHAYLTYDFGSGNTLLIGRTWAIFAGDSPTQYMWEDNYLQAFGDLYAGRSEQIQFSHTTDKMTLNIALEPDAIDEAERFGLTKSYITRELTPALMASVSYTDFGFTVNPSVYIQRYELQGNASGVKDVNILSYAGALDASYQKNKITISSEFWYGQNIYFIGDSVSLDFRPNASNVFGQPIANNNDDDIKNVSSMGGWLLFTLTVEPIVFRVGAGYQQADTEQTGSRRESNVNTWGAFTNLDYAIAKGFMVAPEIVFFDYGKDVDKDKFGANRNKLGSETFVGLHFQYDF
jgi:hypothetical protein